MHKHFVVHGVRLSKLPDIICLGSILWGSVHARNLRCTVHWGKNQLNGDHFKRFICCQEEEDSRGICFAVGLFVNSLHPWEESVMVVYSEELLLLQSLHIQIIRKVSYGLCVQCHFNVSDPGHPISKLYLLFYLFDGATFQFAFNVLGGDSRCRVSKLGAQLALHRKFLYIRSIFASGSINMKRECAIL